MRSTKFTHITFIIRELHFFIQQTNFFRNTKFYTNSSMNASSCKYYVTTNITFVDRLLLVFTSKERMVIFSRCAFVGALDYVPRKKYVYVENI